MCESECVVRTLPSAKFSLINAAQPEEIPHPTLSASQKRSRPDIGRLIYDFNSTKSSALFVEAYCTT